jgi:hypothetical protein
MTGILVKNSTGLILAETCETYPNGWTFDKEGSNAAGDIIDEVAHSGGNSFRFKTKQLAAAQYARWYKSADAKSGANRIARTFRRQPWKGIFYDDFNTADSTLWQGSTPHLTSASICTLDSPGELHSANLGNDPNYMPNGMTCLIKCCPDDGFRWDGWYVTDGDSVRLEFDRESDHKTKLVLGHLGTIDYYTIESFVREWHEWRIEWTGGGSASVYKDGVKVLGPIGTCPNVNLNQQARSMRLLGGGDDSNHCLIDYVGWGAATQGMASFKIGSYTVQDADQSTDTSPLDSGYVNAGWLSAASAPTGSQTVEIKFRNASGRYLDMLNAEVIFDDIVVMLDSQISIIGLLGGQKCELCDSGGSVRKTVTSPQTGTTMYMAISDLITTAYGFSGYFKVYDTDGSTLLYTTATEARWGGDAYQWIPNQTNQDITTDATQIYRSGSGLSPTTASLTVTLTDKELGTKLSDKTIIFTSNLGTCSPTNGTTDSNGQVSTTFTAGTSPGLAGVRADFAGDATYGPSAVQQLIDLYYGEVAADASKDFQIWIEGQEVLQADGSYKLSANFQPQSFNFTTPITSLTIGGWWAVEIYRRGTREYLGRIMKATWRSGSSPQLNVSGVDETIMLQRRAANKSYLDEPKLIIDDLLTRYPCGITAGSIGLYGNVIKLEATYENLYDALTQIARLTGWKFRRNADRSLDFGPDFGEVKDIIVSAGLNSAGATHDIDWSQVDSKVYVVGKDPEAGLVSSAESPAAELVYGLIEDVFLEKNIDEQGTLDLRAQEILSQHEEAKETVSLEWPDMLATGSYGPFDTLTVEDPDADLAGEYQVSAIIRKLQNAEYASLELVTAMITLVDAIQAIRKDIKDLAVA